MGVTQMGMRGNFYETPQEGIRAQIQHLKAYANAEPLNNTLLTPTVGEPRFRFVQRGVAPYVEHLGIQENPQGRGWAAGADYGGKILRILAAICAVEAPDAPESCATSSDWAREAWAWGIKTGLTHGAYPTAPATREEVIQFLYNYHTKAVPDKNNAIGGANS